MNIEYRKYKKDFDYSYTFGVYPTIELLEERPEQIIEILISEKGSTNEGIEKIKKLAKELEIKVELSDRKINRISDKDNVYAVGIFKKYSEKISDGNHLVLVEPSNMGNLGTIIRTSLGFNIDNIAIINSGIDVFNPKVLRGSMGAIYNIKIEYFKNFKDYSEVFSKNTLYPFLLNAEYGLSELRSEIEEPYSLIFGNESSGLDYEYYKDIGKSVSIEQSEKIDSLNLSIAVGIALYEFNIKQTIIC